MLKSLDVLGAISDVSLQCFMNGGYRIPVLTNWGDFSYFYKGKPDSVSLLQGNALLSRPGMIVFLRGRCLEIWTE